MFYDNTLQQVQFKSTDAERAAQIARVMRDTPATFFDRAVDLKKRIFDEVVRMIFLIYIFATCIHVSFNLSL